MILLFKYQKGKSVNSFAITIILIIISLIIVNVNLKISSQHNNQYLINNNSNIINAQSLHVTNNLLNKNHQQQINNYNQNHIKSLINLSFKISLQQSLPILLKNLFQQFQNTIGLQQIKIKMGSRYSHNIPNIFPHNGILAQLYLSKNQDKKYSIIQKLQPLLSILSGIFYISINPQFIVPTLKNQLQLYLIFISNPNDKFCSQQLQSIVNTFLPCQFNSGLASLISSKTFFTQKYVGLQIKWNIYQQSQQMLLINIYIQPTETLSNLINSKLNKCQQFNITQAYDWLENPIKANTPIVQQLIKSRKQYITNIQQKFQKNIEQKGSQSFGTIKTANPKRYIKGNWYSFARQKQLIHSYTIKLEDLLYLQQIIIQQLFPKGFEVLSSQFNYKLNSYLYTQFKSIIIIKSTPTQNNLIIAQFKIQQHEIRTIMQRFQNNFINLQLILTIKFRSLIKPFTNYEAIAGGGQQFMRIPIILKRKNDKNNIKSNKIESIQVPYISDKIMQPDFSIPFHVMTFSCALLGYIWVSVWKIYFSMRFAKNKNNIQIKKDERQQ